MKLAKSLGVVITLIVVAVTIFLVWHSMTDAENNPLSQNAIVTANVVHIASTVSGRIASFDIEENEAVDEGQRLFSIDQKTYQLAVDQAAADLAIARASYAEQQRTISAEESNAAIASAQVERAQANLELATETLNRLLPLSSKGYVSAQEIDNARTAKRDAEISLKEAQKQAEAAEVLVSNTDGSAALVEARRSALAIAEHELSETKVHAPTNGRVVGLNVSKGEFVLPGETVFTLVDTDAWYVSAAYLESDLPRIEIGNCATVYALANRSVPIRGIVEGIGAGVRSEELIDFPNSLPLVPKSLDWVRIAQRFPVRIRLLEAPETLMRIGASATATIHQHNDC